MAYLTDHNIGLDGVVAQQPYYKRHCFRTAYITYDTRVWVAGSCQKEWWRFQRSHTRNCSYMMPGFSQLTDRNFSNAGLSSRKV
jgi:hypothetical protein